MFESNMKHLIDSPLYIRDITKPSIMIYPIRNCNELTNNKIMTEYTLSVQFQPDIPVV